MAWARVQSAVTPATASAVNSVSATYTTANVSSGTKLMAVVSTDTQTGTTDTVATVKDAAGNSFTLIRRNSNGSPNILNDVSLWAIDTPAGDVGTKPTITATLSGGTANIGIIIFEVSGLAVGNTLAAMVDGTPGNIGGTALGATGSPSYTSSAANEYLIGVFGDSGGPITWTKPAALTSDANNVNSSSFANIALAYGNSTGGTEAGSWSLAGSSTEWGVLLVAFKLASSGITGTGSIALPTMKLSGAGTVTPPAAITGTGSIRLPSMAVFGSSARKLILSLAPRPGIDQYGNAYPEGLAVGAAGGSQVEILITGTVGILAFPSGASFEQTIAEIASGLLPVGLTQFIQLLIASAKITTAGSHDQVIIEFNSPAADGSSFANLGFIYSDTGGTFHQFATMDANGFKILAGSAIAAHPGTTPAVPETWQSLGSFGSGAWFINQGRYRMTTDGECEIDIALNAQTGGGASGLFTWTNTIPSAYQFAGNYSRSYPMGFNGVITSGANQGYILVDGAGTPNPGRVRMGLPALPATTNLCATIRMPLS